MWSLSSFMMLFEYKRALGHVWYVHPLFWWFSIIVYEADVVLWRTQHDVAKSDWHLVVAFICASIFSLFLGLLSILFPNDVPFERRDYIASSDKHLQEAMIRRDSLVSRPSEDIENKIKPIPIITAKVSSQISIDQ